MNDPQLTSALESVSSRYRRVIMGAAAAGGLGVVALGGFALRQWLHGADYSVPLFAAGYATLFGAALSPVVISMLRKTRDPVWLAHKIEKKFPELDTRLLAAVEQPDKTKDSGFLQQLVISQSVSHARRTGWDQIVPQSRIRAARAAQWSMVALCAIVGCSVLWEGGKIVVGKGNPPRDPIVGKASLPFDVKIEAEKEIERGSALLVTATFGNGRLPAAAQLLYREKDAETKEQDMSKSALNDPRFATRLPAVTRDLQIAVRYDGKQTEWQDVKVFEFPQLKQADAHLKYPEYTNLGEKELPNTRIVSAVEGTNVTLTFKLNKEVADATLVPTPRAQGRGGNTTQPAGTPPARGGQANARGGGGGRGGRVGALAAQNGRGPANDIIPDGVGAPNIKLEKSATDPTVYTVKMDLRQSQFYSLQLVDSDKRNNRDRATMTLNVTADRPTVVRVTAPSRDVEVSPLEELTVKGQVSDDFGVKRVGITYTMRGEQKDVVIAENVPAKERRDVAHLISLEDLNAQPDELLAYNLWAEDTGPDGKVRRSMSDIFFAEVRPFEEIYRQGQQPAEGQQQQRQQQQQQQQQEQQQAAQRAEDITNQLKQIISAMWTLTRREVSETLTTEFVPDVQAIAEAQQAARDAAGGLIERITDERAMGFLESGMKNLEKASQLLKDSETGPTAKPLPDAIAADTAAYNDFLKLRERQFEVVRGNRQQQQGNTAQARRQQQLNQLDLQEQQNRYQTQRQAEQEQQELEQQQRQAQQNENRQVLNRLRDLAQRQEDLNQQMREMQSALQEAQNQEQREEVQRQLARLQEQQQQQLQETDELQQRLEEPQNQESMADARQQLEQARENVQQAAQQLGQGQPGQAAAAGQRASEQLNELRDQVRREAGNQFADAMQQMRNDARQLEQGAQENAQQLAELEQAAREPAPTAGGGLRNNQQQEIQDTRRQLAQNLEQQRNQLNRLMENMQQTVQEAESTEPLLSRQLYDTIRQSQQRPPERALSTTEQLLRQGFTQEARQTNEEATQGITRIREGVEQAAANILGDETEALRRARDEVDALSAALDREIGRNIQQQQQLAEAQARGGRGQNGQQNQQPGRGGRDGQQPGENPGQNPDERQLANAGGRGEQPGQNPQQAGRGTQPGQGARGGRGQNPGEGQEPGAGTGEGDERQLANGGRGQGDPNQEGQPAGQGQRGGRAGRGAGGEPQEGDPQLAEGQEPGPGQPGGRGGQGQRGGRAGRGGAGGEPQEGDPQLAEGQEPGQGQPGGRGGQGQRGGRGGTGQGEPQEGDPQLAEGQEPGQGQPGGRGGQGQRGGRGGTGQGDPNQEGDPQLAEGQEPGQGQPGGRGGQGQRGGRGGNRGGPGLQGDPNQEGQPGDPQLAEGQEPGQGQPGGRGGLARGGPQGQQNQLGGGGGGAITNPLQIGGANGGQLNNLDPITGDGYRNFSDGLRNLQDILSDPQLQQQAQQIRERASAVRLETRNGRPPNWNIVQNTIGKPLAELQQKIDQELLKREKSQAALVPLDREPVPPEYQEQVKQYYEKLGSGK